MSEISEKLLASTFYIVYHSKYSFSICNRVAERRILKARAKSAFAHMQCVRNNLWHIIYFNFKIVWQYALI